MNDEPATRTQRRTILFVDIVSSTALYEDLGDAAARARVGPCMEALAGVVEGHGGRLLSSLGDGLLASFATEGPGVAAALDMIDQAPLHRLRVHVGLHAGETDEEQDGEVSGRTVHLAMSISSLSKPSEILISRDVYDSMPPELQEHARLLPDLTVKGVRDAPELYVLDRREDSLTTLNISAADLREELQTCTGLELVYEGQTHRVGLLKAFSLGRGPENDLIVDSKEVSRSHARISFRRGKMVLTDQSVNGTWLVPEKGSGVLLLREEAPLPDTGRLFLGVNPEHGDHAAIRFKTSTGHGSVGSHGR